MAEEHRRAQAQQQLDRAEGMSSRDQHYSQQAALGAAQVHAALYLADEVKALRETIAGVIGETGTGVSAVSTMLVG